MLLRVFVGICWLHGYHLVGSLFAISIRDFDQHTVLLNSELNLLTHWQNDGMFVVGWPNVIFHLVSSYHVLWAQLFVGVHMGDARRRPYRTQPCQSFLFGAARHRFHFLKHGPFDRLLFLALR